MSRYKQHIGKNVLLAAKERLHHIHDIHDSVVVLFSGGKDSQVVLHLAWEVAQERGLKFVNALFQHDEFMMKPVVDLVRHYADMPWVRMHHLVIPKFGVRYVFDRPIEFRQWDIYNRETFVQIPDYAIRPKKEEWERLWAGDEIEKFQCQFFEGKVAQVNGIRASESRYRWRASVNKLIENYINYSIDDRTATMCKPIFDWEERDVFKYLYDNKLQYCKVYDWQFFCKMGLRMSQPLHPEKLSELKKLRQIDPTFYDRILQIFPDQVVHDRYADEKDTNALVQKYGNDGLNGVYNYIEDFYKEEKLRAIALSRLYQLQQLEASDRARRENTYPTAYVLKYFIRGQFGKLLLPFRRNTKEWKTLT
jgi:predicted phosphoadenosine phosphosulfate sulfurtransferase